jgi:hypothetical protein
VNPDHLLYDWNLLSTAANDHRGLAERDDDVTRGFDSRTVDTANFWKETAQLANQDAVTGYENKIAYAGSDHKRAIGQGLDHGVQHTMSEVERATKLLAI